MRTLTAFLILLSAELFVLVAVPAQVKQAKEGVEVTISPSEAMIREGDPLFLKVRVQNHGTKPVSFVGGRRPTTLDRALGLEMRRAGEEKYHQVRTIYGDFVDVVVTKPFELRPSEMHVSYEVFFRWGQGAIFNNPGKYELRAVVYGDGWKVVSKPIAVQVEKTPDAEKEIIEREGDYLYNAVGIHTGHLNPVRLAGVEAKLTTGNLKRTLRGILAVLEVRHAKDQAARSRALQALEELRKELDPVAAEMMDLRLAAAYIDIKDVAEAEKLLKKFKAPCPDVYGLRQRLEPLKSGM
jgi:uncharacterized protein (DUF58 family)